MSTKILKCDLDCPVETKDLMNLDNVICFDITHDKNVYSWHKDGQFNHYSIIKEPSNLIISIFVENNEELEDFINKLLEITKNKKEDISIID